MKKYKIYKYILILFILIFILVPSISAKTVTTTYNNYYFFLDQYSLSDVNSLKNKTTTNYTAFPPISKFGVDKEKSAEEVCLVRKEEDKYSSCTKEQIDNDLVWTYYEFYEMYFKTETNSNSHEENYKIDEVSHTSKVFEEKNNKYYTHGSYSSDNGKTWSVGSNNTLFDRYDYKSNFNLLACASIKTLKNTLTVEKYGNYFKIIIKRTLGNYDVNTNMLDVNSNMSNCPTDEIYRIYNKQEDQKNILSPVLYKYSYTVTEEVCDSNISKSDVGKCNSGDNTLISNCQKETITTSNARADVKINQKGTVANILTPDSIYQGGGFKLAFVYYNEISWDFADDKILTTLSSKTEAKNEITAEMKKKIQSLGTFEKNVILDNIMFGKEDIDSNLIQKECIRSDKEFNPGETITTVCTFYLPNSVIEPYTGKVTYSTSFGINHKVNNKYYTPLTYEGKYNIKANLNNLNVLNRDSEYWVGDWNLIFDGEKDNSCQIDVYGQLYNKAKAKYIYRPIDLKNPFPNRNAGINWYNWYQDDKNKYDLEHSYNDLEYSFNLDNENLSNIKKYNNDKDVDGMGYFNWEDIDNGKSSFVDEYAEKVGDNS